MNRRPRCADSERSSHCADTTQKLSSWLHGYTQSQRKELRWDVDIVNELARSESENDDSGRAAAAVHNPARGVENDRVGPKGPNNKSVTQRNADHCVPPGALVFARHQTGIHFGK